MEQNKVIKTKVDLVKIIDDPYYFFYPESSTLKVWDGLYRETTFREYKVEGEALELMMGLDEGKHESFEEYVFISCEAHYQEKKAAEEKERKEFEFRCLASGKWFEYKLQASSLADAERIGWEKLAQDTAHWKYGSARSWSVTSWSCQ
ncbi:MAG: hypothetical protein EOM67_16775 [Spirochaetia bacterium]|nr:hypothetical protein [Spirochaetia bacterium]